jgi:hypothetical protein
VRKRYLPLPILLGIFAFLLIPLYSDVRRQLPEKPGCQVFTAASGQEAIEVFERRRRSSPPSSRSFSRRQRGGDYSFTSSYSRLPIPRCWA